MLYGGTAIALRLGHRQSLGFGVPALPRLQPPDVVPSYGLQVASLIDLAGTQASVVQVRGEAKDYIDIDALLGVGIRLPQMLTAARMLYGPSFNPQITLKALSYYVDGNLAQWPDVVKNRLAAAARETDLDQLPESIVSPGIPR